MKRLIKYSAGIALLMMLSGCSLFKSGPAATVENFYRAVERGNVDDAINLLSSSFRSQMGDAKIRAAFSEQTSNIANQKKGISSIRVVSEDIQGQSATVVIDIKYGDGSSERDTNKLVMEDGKWKISPAK